MQILIGESEAALDQLEKMLAMPTDCVSVPMLRISPLYDPLRSNPRFQRLIEKAS